MRQELAHNDGFWWHRIGTDFYCRKALLGEWDSIDNYEQVTDAEYNAETEELTDADALNIILGND